MIQPTVSIIPNQPFPWHRGVRLQAIEESYLVFPGELVGPEEPMGSIIEASDDDMQIEFERKPEGGFKTIRIRLKPGQSLALRRGTEVILVAEDGRERKFNLFESMLPQTIRARLFVGLPCLFFAFGAFAFLKGVVQYDYPPNRWARAIVLEVALAWFFFSVAAVVWCVARPRFIERFLVQRTTHLAILMGILAVVGYV